MLNIWERLGPTHMMVGTGCSCGIGGVVVALADFEQDIADYLYAGNSGPAAGTVAHPSPWITTVAAGTHNRDGRGSVTLGNGTTYQGSSFATAVGARAC